jgi:hypothetical protein
MSLSPSGWDSGSGGTRTHKRIAPPPVFETGPSSGRVASVATTAEAVGVEPTGPDPALRLSTALSPPIASASVIAVDPPGIEPGSSVRRTDVLPLDDRPIFRVETVGIEPTTNCLQGSLAAPWYMRPHSSDQRSARELNPDFFPTTEACGPNTCRPSGRNVLSRRLPNRVIPDGLEPSSPGCEPAASTLEHGTNSSRGGTRTHRRQALDLTAVPICVLGRRTVAEVGFEPT